MPRLLSRSCDRSSQALHSRPFKPHARRVVIRSPAPEKTSLVFFDAAGTLIGIREPVGETYSRIARDFDIASSPAVIDDAFRRSFENQPPMAFARDLSPSERNREEFLWWKNLAAEVFGKVSSTPRFDAFFSELFEFYRHADAWRVYSDVVPTLESLRSQNLMLAVVSNFDSRLRDILKETGLDAYFEAIHLSTHTGFAKPDPRIFTAALAEHRVAARYACHVGDSLEDDADSAGKAGIRGIWLDRHREAPNESRYSRITSLRELPDLLKL